MKAASSSLLPSGQPNCPDTVDGLPAAARALVHEFGYSVVRAFDMAGVRDPRVIRRLVHAVWLGAREPGNKPAGMPVPAFVKSLDAAWPHLTNAVAMIRYLTTLGLMVSPRYPSPGMVQASIDEVGKHGIVSKAEKHSLRLRAALRQFEYALLAELDGQRRTDA